MLLTVVEKDKPPSVTVRVNKITLSVRPGSDRDERQDILERWYREQIRSEVPKLIEQWETLLGVKVDRFFVQRMKTRWGSCNPATASIRLNTNLAKKPIQCLEYIVVHEMMHLLEPTRNARFVALMDRFMPQWQERRQLLNLLPVRHEDREY
ncbi:SprT-like family protein [Pirellula sp. SH-Sr6A]|uniref:M48 family metallopeptidase n=1 Tax=Pirellula sp. SH-Sr6A TaxID=1632865 RepID=UPI00078D0B8F|nr:SprT family zinc-dependent metalloprotease [Pirellula sp. SH-Sr6A]AMV33299.1 SprT-like family protein [Pirellula sp. SH-Sr6A]